jgi:glutamine synthetase adenylyltransferase
MMLIKARCVAGDAGLGGEFLEMVQPFRYPRSLSDNVLHEIAAIKGRIEGELVKKGGLERNVKLGRGGIREIEFVAQTLQLLNGGRNPFIQSAQTLPTLQKLVQYHLLDVADVDGLTRAYVFLRDVEHRLQMEHNRQTHSLPVSTVTRERLAALMGFTDSKRFEQARADHSNHVRAVYERLLKPTTAQPTSGLPSRFDGREGEWQALLDKYSFRDPAHALRLLREFALGPGYGHVSPRTTDLAMQLIPKLLSFCPRHMAKSEEREDFGGAGKTMRIATGQPSPLIPLPVGGRGKPKGAGGGTAHAKELQGVAHLSLLPQPREGRGEEWEESGGERTSSGLVNSASHSHSVGPILSDPDRVVARLDSFVSAYGARATLYEMWSSNTALFELLLFLFDRSEFLAEVAIRTPDLIDELMLSGHLQRRKKAEAIFEELRHGAQDADQRAWIRRYHQSELMRIGLRDILGLAGHEQNFEELSALADACLCYALEVVTRNHKLKSPPFTIIGWGKLGGLELNYGSDLDITFVAPPNARQLPKLQGMAVELMDLLSSPTEFGVAFVTDARLRPDGEKGLLVNTIDACEEYYRRRGALWEFQSLTRTRFIAGNAKVGEQFRAMAAALTNFSKRPRIPAFTPEWKQEIAKMRQRIEKERTPTGKDALAIKTGSGGLIDAEFIAQVFCLEHGWHEPNTLTALQRAEREGVLGRLDAGKLIQNYGKLRRIEAILRRWSYAGETVLPDDPAPLYRVAVRCGFTNADEFMRAIRKWRKIIREVYSRIFA